MKTSVANEFAWRYIIYQLGRSVTSTLRLHAYKQHNYFYLTQFLSIVRHFETLHAKQCLLTNRVGGSMSIMNRVIKRSYEGGKAMLSHSRVMSAITGWGANSGVRLK